MYSTLFVCNYMQLYPSNCLRRDKACLTFCHGRCCMRLDRGYFSRVFDTSPHRGALLSRQLETSSSRHLVVAITIAIAIAIGRSSFRGLHRKEKTLLSLFIICARLYFLVFRPPISLLHAARRPVSPSLTPLHHSRFRYQSRAACWRC